ncbi:MAG: hypothetical protein IT434_03750 [Phycisphaerales bacterium]|nr:hypothetical protein [Phycisphaerales bacterium]
MLRAVASVFVGYIVMAAIVMIALTGLYLALGTDAPLSPAPGLPPSSGSPS